MADLSGGLSSSINLRPVLRQIKDKIDLRSEMNKSLFKEQLHENGEDPSASSPPAPPRRLLAPKARIQVERASLPDYPEIQGLAAKLQDMVDLDRVVVAVGFGEVGKYTSSCVKVDSGPISANPPPPSPRSIRQQPNPVGSRVLRHFLGRWLRGVGLGHGPHQVLLWPPQRQGVLRLA